MKLITPQTNKYRLRDMIRDLGGDYRRYQSEGRDFIGVLFQSQGFWALFNYRVLRAFVTHIPFLNVIPQYIAGFGKVFIEICTGISLPYKCSVEAGLLIPHFGPVVINHRVAIGSNCTIHQGVTIGAAGRNEKRGSPVLGSRVFVGANAVIVGPITIGDDAAIGAGAVVTKDVPPRAVVVGNPGRIVSYRGSFELIKYPGMDDDPDRMAAIAAAGLAGTEASA